MSMVIEVEGGVVIQVYQNRQALSERFYDILDWDTIDDINIEDFIKKNKRDLPGDVLENLHNYKKNSQLVNVVDNVCDTMAAASKHGLAVEVVSSALVYLKENPNASISDALNFGLGEWVK